MKLSRRAKFTALGFYHTESDNTSERQAVLRGLRELGYVEGQNIIVEQSDKAAEFVRLKVDVIVVFGTSAALAAKKATNTIPIVMTSSANPVSNGLITESSPTRRKRNGANEPERRVGRKTIGAAQGNRAPPLPRDRPGAGKEFNGRIVYQRNPGPRACVESSVATFLGSRARGLRGDISTRSQRTG